MGSGRCPSGFSALRALSVRPWFLRIDDEAEGAAERLYSVAMSGWPKDSRIPTGGEPWRADPLAAPEGFSTSRGAFPESAALRQPRGQARLSGLAVPLAWAVPQPRAAVMVTAVEVSVVADAAGSMHGFPAALTSFVGRAAVVDEIAGQLGQYRLVTVTGPGGPGRRGWPAKWRSRWPAGSLTGCGWPSWRRCGTRRRCRPRWRRGWGSVTCPRWRRPMRLAHALARRPLLLVLGRGVRPESGLRRGDRGHGVGGRPARRRGHRPCL